MYSNEFQETFTLGVYKILSFKIKYYVQLRIV